MNEITRLQTGEYFFKVPAAWKDGIVTWKLLPQILESVFIADNIVYIDLNEVEHLSAEVFTVLFDTASLAGKTRTKLFFIGVAESLEERIALLSNSSE